jgi:hypothetical protein
MGLRLTRARCIWIDITAAFGIEPDVQGAILYDLNFVEVKIRVTAEVFFNDPAKVLLINFNLAFYEALVLVVFTG